MFNNIGKKIKILALIFFCITFIFFAVIGFYQISNEQFSQGLFIISLGIIISWLSVFTLYAFGQLVENSDKSILLQKEILNKLTINIEENKDCMEDKDIVNNNNSSHLVKTENKEQASKIIYTSTTNNINEEGIMSALKYAQETLKNISKEDIQKIKENNKTWVNDISNMPVTELSNILTNKHDSMQEEYIYLCCHALIELYESTS